MGTGAVSHAVASDLRHVDGARRVAGWSRDADKARAFAAEDEFESASDSFEIMLADTDTDTDIDVVCIATPTPLMQCLLSPRAGRP